MSRTTKYSYLLFLVISTFGLLCCFSQKNEAIQRIIASISDVSLKKGLISFEKEGIEKSVESKEKLNLEKLIETANSYMDTPHCFGGSSKKCIDCSGLLWASFNQLGAQLPHSSHEQARFGNIIPYMKDLKRGDLVFFYGTYSTTKLITHSGIYLGDGQFIHTSSKRGVEQTSLFSDYWKDHYLFATRVVE